MKQEREWRKKNKTRPTNKNICIKDSERNSSNHNSVKMDATRAVELFRATDMVLSDGGGSPTRILGRHTVSIIFLTTFVEILRGGRKHLDIVHLLSFPLPEKRLNRLMS